MITEWIMCGLTVIYVGATVAIFRSNKRSADAASEQIEESRRIQEQNTALQLLNQRIDIYKTIVSWTENAKIISTGTEHFKDTLPRLQSLIFNNATDDVVEKNMRIALLRKQLQEYMLPRNEREAMEIEIRFLEQDIFLKKIAALSQELKIIELAEVCFETTDYVSIKDFADAYIDMAVHIGDEIKNGGAYLYANALSSATQKMLDNQIIQQMKEEMKAVRK